MRVLGHTGRGAEHALPDPAQTLLLRAAVAEADAARAAWEQWYPTTDIDALDWDAHRMFPLLYRNLEAVGIDCPDLPRLKGVYRHYWYANQLLLRDARVALQALRDNEIETLALKGLALTAMHYRDGGTRPMNDVDVLVHPRDAPSAVRVLRELGYVHRGPLPLEVELRIRHAIPLYSESGRELQARGHGTGAPLDLHWYTRASSVGDEDLWIDSVPLVIAGVETRALCPSDQLLHACVRSGAPMRWLADAATVIRASGDQLDWDRLVDRAITRQCSVSLLDGLGHLERLLDVGVPPSVMGRLRAARPSRAERLAHRVAARPYAHGYVYALEWDRYRRLRGAGAPGVPTNFASYMVERWNLDGYRELARLLARKALQVVRYGVSEPGDGRARPRTG
jgi:hypothetical protein